MAVHHWGNAVCCNKLGCLAAVGTAVSGEQQGCTFTNANLSPVLLPLSPPTFILIESQYHQLFLHAANEKPVEGTDATETTNVKKDLEWKRSSEFGPREVAVVLL